MKEERRGRESELAKEGVSQRGRTNSLASSSTLAVVCNLYLRSKHVANGRGEGDITSQPRQWRLISRLVLDTACDSVLECAVSRPSPFPAILRVPVRLLFSLSPRHRHRRHHHHFSVYCSAAHLTTCFPNFQHH